MGKKRKYTEQVGVMFEPEILERLNEITDILDISNSEFIRKITEEKIAKSGELIVANKPQISREKENEIWGYFNQYLRDSDPAGPYEEDWEDDDDQSELDKEFFIDGPDEWFTCGFSIRGSWDELGLALIVEGRNAEAQELKNIYDNEKDLLKTTFPESKFVFQSDTVKNQIIGKLNIIIDERPISEGVKLPFEQNERVIEKLADAQIAFHHAFCLTR